MVISTRSAATNGKLSGINNDTREGLTMENENKTECFMEAMDMSNESKKTLIHKIRNEIKSSALSGQSAVLIKLPGTYDFIVVDEIMLDLKKLGYHVERRHSTDEVYIDWMLGHIPGMTFTAG
jgi:hypothetical protein